jgi:hypothetical protein
MPGNLDKRNNLTKKIYNNDKSNTAKYNVNNLLFSYSFENECLIIYNYIIVYCAIRLFVVTYVPSKNFQFE